MQHSTSYRRSRGPLIPGTRSFSLLLCLAMSGAPHGVLAQRQPRPEGEALPGRALTQYGLDSWDDRHGLPQNSVQAITQSADGYVWFGTQEGLVRFDGLRFRTYGRATSPALPHPYIWALAPDPDGGVWVGTEQAGLLHVRRDSVRVYTKVHGLPSDYVMSLQPARDGTLWIGTMNGGLARLRNGRFVRFDSTRFAFRNVLKMTESVDGAIWTTSPRGVARIRGDSVLAITRGLPTGGPLAITAARSGGVWLGTTAGRVARIASDGRIQAMFGPAQGIPPLSIEALNEDADGSLWIAAGATIVRLAGTRAEVLPPRAGLSADVRTFHRDHEGSLWIGMDGGGVARMRETPIVPVGVPEGLSTDFVFPILQDRAGAMWVGTGGGGLHRLHGGAVEHFSQARGTLAHDMVLALEELRDGSLWVGTAAGITILRAGRATHLRREAGVLDPFVRAIVEDRAGRIWLASNTGLQRLRPGPPRRYTQADGLADDFVLSLHEDAEGALWIGTRDGLSVLRNERITTWTHADGLPDAPVMSLLADPDGTIWIAAGGALSRFRNGRFAVFRERDGLCDEVIHHILDDGRGRLWFNSNRGIFSLQRNELEEFAAGGTRRLRCTLYGRGDGMRAREGNGAVNPAGWRAADGRLWFPTVGGVAIVDPRRLHSGLAAPRVQIEELIAGDVTHSPPPVHLPAGTRDLEIHYTALSFVAPERIRFRYRLDGFDEEWTDAGNRRVAYYTHLPPGRYTFRVAASNADGVWNEEGTAHRFRIQPHPWQTAWFRLLAATLAIAALGLLYRLRVRSLERRAQQLLALVQERTRAEARYRDLFENASDVVITTDLEGNFTAINRKAQELTGYTGEQAAHLNVRDILPHSASTDRLLADWLRGRPQQKSQIEVLASDGTRVPLEISSRVVRDGGVPTGMQVIARDMRERAALERQLRQAQKMEAVGQLAGGVAHDFNNLLTVIRGSTEFLLESISEDSDTRTDVEHIAAAAERASTLTRQLLAFSRRQVVQPRIVDLNDLVHGVAPMLRRLIGEDIVVECAACAEPARVLADPGQLEQVLVNLAVNARDAMPGGGRLQFGIEIVPVGSDARAPVQAGSGRCVVLSVSDTGTGMDSITQARIFEPFFTTKEPGKGTGLGLSTVYGIVRQCGGEIRCISAPGEGTTFRIYVPFTDAAESGRAVTAPGTAEGGNETILLVEDEEPVRTLISRILRRLGYRVLATADGPAALATAADHAGPIHVLLTDMVMPALSGRELAERLLAGRADTRVLYMSGYTDDEILRRGMHDARTAFLQKPFTAATLANAVRAVLAAPAATLDPDAERLTA